MQAYLRKIGVAATAALAIAGASVVTSDAAFAQHRAGGGGIGHVGGGAGHAAIGHGNWRGGGGAWRGNGWRGGGWRGGGWGPGFIGGLALGAAASPYYYGGYGGYY